MLPACHTCGAALAPTGSASGLCPACLLADALSGDPGPELAASSHAALAPGAAFGPFRIEGVLGKGGMATVYRAYETALDRVVALKVLPPEFLHDDAFAKRFHQEARIVAALEHPHIVPLYASGIQDGIPWMSMRLLSGGSLAGLLNRLAKQPVGARRGRLDEMRVIQILRGVADALDYAHARGVVHRDVKPSNILLDRSGHVCVADFGLARMIEGSLALTRTGVLTGTPHYMAPEQGLGGSVDHRTDIYALGVVAYEMFTGRPPFDADSPLALLMKHVTEPLPSPSRSVVPDAVFAALRKALAKQPADRWEAASQFVSALESSVATRAPGTMSRVGIWAAGAAATAAVAVASFLPRATPVHTTPASAANPTAATAPDAPREAPQPPDTTQPPAENPAPSRGSTQNARRPSSRASQTENTTAPAPPSEPTAPAADNNDPPPPQRFADQQMPPTAQPIREREATTADDSKTAGSPMPASDAPALPTAPTESITQPVRIRTVSPVYPAFALAARIQGDVVLQALVGRDGVVTAAEVVKSVHPLLDEAARRAVLQYSYRPGLRNGIPDTFRVQATVSFKVPAE